MLTNKELAGGLPEVFQEFKQSIFSDLHVATIAVVTAIDPDTGLLTVQPVINERRVQDDGTTVWQAYAAIPDTPYISPMGTAPTVGQPVLIIFCDQDISGWLAGTGSSYTGTPTPQIQQVLHSHSLNSAIAILGLVNNYVATPTTQYTQGAITGSTTDNGTGISAAGLQFIREWEGCRLDWYQDIGGNWTIGVGHMNNDKVLPAGFTAPLTIETAEALLQHDLPTYIAGVHSAFPSMTFTQNQADALISFAFNLGANIFPDTKLQDAILAGASTDRLKVLFEEYCHADHKVVLGLLYRRDAEWALYTTGNYLSR